MAYTAPPASATQGTLHFVPPISAFEIAKSAGHQPDESTNTLLWIGGLFDVYRSVTYPYTLPSRVPSNWNVAQLLLSSSNHGWGHGSLGNDVDEMAKAVSYFRNLRPKGKIVIMGHSTGCQDCMHYIVSPERAPTKEQGMFAGANAEKEADTEKVQAQMQELKVDKRPSVDGIILQAPVSDREALVNDAGREKMSVADKLAQEYIDQGREEDCLPLSATGSIFGPCPVSAKRWLSLSSPDGKGEDDYFSSDFGPERLKETFGKFPSHSPMLILWSGADQYVHKSIDARAVLGRWMDAVRSGGGVVDDASKEPVPGATHNLNEAEPQAVEELCLRVAAFLEKVGKGQT